MSLQKCRAQPAPSLPTWHEDWAQGQRASHSVRHQGQGKRMGSAHLAPLCSLYNSCLLEEAQAQSRGRGCGITGPSSYPGEPGSLGSEGQCCNFTIQTQAHPSTLSPAGSRAGSQDWRGAIRTERDELRGTPGNFGKTRSSLKGGERAEQVLSQSLVVSGRWSVCCLEPNPTVEEFRGPSQAGDSGSLCSGP